MIKTLNELAHLQKFTRPDFTVDPDVFFDFLHSRKIKIIQYLKKMLDECIAELKLSRNVSCTAKIHRSFFQWDIPCLLKSHNFKQEFAKLEINKELVARGLVLDINCNKKNTSIIIDELFEKFFSKVNVDYPIYPLPQQYLSSIDGMVSLDFVIIYPRAQNEKYYRFPPYNPNTFEFPDYNERFKLALNDLGIKKPDAQTQRIIEDIITTWNDEWNKNKDYQHPKYFPDRWRLWYDGHESSHYYMRGSDEEIDGLKYLIQHGYCFQDVRANDYEYKYNEDIFYSKIGEDKDISNEEITDSEDQFEMGLDFELSYQDGEKASYWYSKSAEQGNWKGMYSLALLYYLGELVEKNYSISLKWFTKSADEDDDGWADFYLGEMYANGYGIVQNLDTARHWYVRAADKGHEDALKTINKLGFDYDDSKYKLKKEQEEELRRIEEEKKKLIEAEVKERKDREIESMLNSEYSNLLEYLNSKDYSQPDYEIDLSVFYTSKHAEGKPVIDDIVNGFFHKCCNDVGLFNEDESGCNCFFNVYSESYFNTPRLLTKIELSKKYNKINGNEKLVIRTFSLLIDLEEYNQDDFPKAKKVISLFLKEINKDYPCFIERYSKYYESYSADDFKENDMVEVLIGIIYPADYEETPLILPIENQAIETIDSKKLINACSKELLSNPDERYRLLEINNIKGSRKMTDSKIDRTKQEYDRSFSNNDLVERGFCYSDRGCLIDDKGKLLFYFMRGSPEEKIAIKTSLLIGYYISYVEYRNAKFNGNGVCNVY